MLQCTVAARHAHLRAKQQAQGRTTGACSSNIACAMVQEYLVETVAKVAAAEKEYRAAGDHMDRPLLGSAADVDAKGKAKAAGEGGGGGGFSEEELDSWHLDAVDLILRHTEDQGDRAAAAIRDQLTVIDECGPPPPCAVTGDFP